MPKVSVEVKTGRMHRSYKGDYVFVAVLNEDGVGCRWEQEPAGWCDGLGLFYTGMESLRTVAEQEGTESFKEASRIALLAISALDPNKTQEEREECKQLLMANLSPVASSASQKKAKRAQKEAGIQGGE